MAQGYVECRFETGTGPGKESGVSSSFAAKVIYFPATTFNFDTNPNPLERDDEMRTQNEPIRFDQEAFAPSWSMDIRAYPDVAAFLLKAHLGAPTTTAGDGVIADLAAAVIPVGATRHTWTAPYATGSTPQTIMFRVVVPEHSMYWDVRGASVESLEWSTPDSGGVMLRVSGKANYISSIANPALTATYESLAIAPFLRAHAALTWLASSATCETLNVGVSKQVEHVRTYGGGSKWPDITEHGEGVVQISGQFDGRTITSADWAAMIAATRFTALISYVHTSIIATAYPYKMFIQAPNTSAAYISGGPADIQNRKRTPSSWNFRFTRDSAVSATIQVVNATASYA